MKNLPCISRSKTANDPIKSHPTTEDKKENYVVDAESRASKFQTFVEVLKCDFGKPVKPSSTTDGVEHMDHWTPLYHAVYSNREAALVHFLRAGQIPDGTPDTQPPLCIAVAAGHSNITKILCEAGANINVRSIISGETPLHLAIKAGRNDILDILLRHRPNLDARTIYTHDTPLHYAAAREGSIYGVSALLTHGANFEAVNDKGCSPAEIALQNQNLEMAIAIIRAAGKKPPKLVKERRLLLTHALESHGRSSISNVLFAQALEVACPADSTGLVEAIKTKDANIVTAMLARGANPNESTASGLYPIFAAIDTCSVSVVQALVEHKADVTLRNPHGPNVLQVALESPLSSNKNAIAKVFELLLTHGANATIAYSNGRTLLHHALQPSVELVRIAQLLLQRGVKVDAQDNNGDTALHVAATSPPCVTMLLKHGAKPNLVNNKGLTPLLYALGSSASDKEPDLQQLLTASDLRKANASGKRALHLAAQNGFVRTVKILLKLGADTNSIDSKKRTPLLLAVFRQQWSVVPLLASQPGMNSWDENGMTALHHIAMSAPKDPSTWKHIAVAAAPFCEKGVSCSMRDQSGSTPLIQAIKTLPEDGIPVIETLLLRRGLERSNCIAHEDHSQHNALYYAVAMGKAKFVEVLLMHGTPFSWNEWRQQKKLLATDSAVNKQIWKLFAEHEWLRRVARLRRQSGVATDESLLPKILPIEDLSDMLCVGLGTDNIPRARSVGSLLWILLETGLTSSVTEPNYLCDALTLIIASGANPNAMSSRRPPCTPNMRHSQGAPLAVHPLVYVLEKNPRVDMALIKLLLDNGSKQSIPSPFYEGRYPLHSAVRAHRVDVMEELLRREADVDCKDAQQRTPIFAACESGYDEIVELLLHSGANIDAKDHMGYTPLHAAVATGNSPTVSLLLSHGAQPDSQNKKGLTPLRCLSAKLSEDKKQEITTNLQRATEQASQFLSPPPKLPERRDAKKKILSPTEPTIVLKKKKSVSSSTKNTTPPRPSPNLSAFPSTVPTPKPTIVNIHRAKQPFTLQITPPPPPLKVYLKPAASVPEVEPASSNVAFRKDSGFDLRKVDVSGSGAAPVLDRERGGFDKIGEVVGEGDELRGWLNVSKMLGGL